MNAFFQMLTNHKQYIYLLGYIALGITVGFVIAAYTFHQYSQALNDSIVAQSTQIQVLAEMTARNEVDRVTDTLVQDCQINDRIRFNRLLDSLDTNLNETELRELHVLFADCGDYHAQRKKAMVAKLTREIEMLETLASIQTGMPTFFWRINEYDVQAWRMVVEGEQTQNVLSQELVRLQKEIIDALLANMSPESDDMRVLLTSAREVKESLVQSKLQTDKLRSDLTQTSS